MTATAPQTAALPKDLLRIADLSSAALLALLADAAAMKGDPRGWVDSYPGRTVAAVVEEPSTRTRMAHAAAAQRLGLLPIALSPDELGLGRREPVEDTARTLSAFCAAIAMRVASERTLERVAKAAEVPVLNLGSERHHPCQALADLLTLRERFGRLLGRRLAYVGAGDAVAHSLLEAAPRAGMDIALACPPGHWPDAEIVTGAAARARAAGTQVIVVDDPREAVEGAHAVVAGAWAATVGGDDPGRLADLAPYRVTTGLMAAARPEAVFLHPLPARRGQEVDAAVIDGPASVVFVQAANRLAVEQAVLYALLG